MNAPRTTLQNIDFAPANFYSPVAMHKLASFVCQIFLGNVMSCPSLDGYI